MQLHRRQKNCIQLFHCHIGNIAKQCVFFVSECNQTHWNVDNALYGVAPYSSVNSPNLCLFLPKNIQTKEKMVRTPKIVITSIVLKANARIHLRMKYVNWRCNSLILFFFVYAIDLMAQQIASLKRISNELIAIKFISKSFLHRSSVHFRLYINLSSLLLALSPVDISFHKSTHCELHQMESKMLTASLCLRKCVASWHNVRCIVFVCNYFFFQRGEMIYMEPCKGEHTYNHYGFRYVFFISGFFGLKITTFYRH